MDNRRSRATEPLDFERWQRASIEILYQATTALHSTLQYDQVLDLLLEQLSLFIQHDAACIMLIRGQMARIFRWHGYARFGNKNVMKPLVLKIADVPSLRAVRESGQPLIVDWVDENDGWVRESGQLWVKSYMVVPIRIGDQVIGFVHVDSALSEIFGQTDADLLQTFINRAAVALNNARLYEQARREIMMRVKALKTERNFVSAVLDNAGALVVILDSEQRIIQFNRTCEKTTGYSLSEVKGRHIWDVFTIMEEADAIKSIFERLAGGQSPIEYESQWLTKDGDICPIAWSSTVLQDQQGAVEYIINTGHDITERKQVEEALRRGGERYALAVLAANEGLWDWDLKTDEIYFSPRWKAILGYPESELQSNVNEWFSRVHPDDLAHLKIDIAVHLEGTTSSFKSEYRMRHWDGEYRWVLTQGLAMRDTDGQPYRLTGSQTDITRRKLNEDRLVHASLHDALTGLPNRTLFVKHLERAIDQARENQDYMFAVLFLDLDRFKVINDSLGHLTGDQLLITVARRLKACLRAGDTVARLGGDEFTILIEDIREVEDAVRVADRIQKNLALPVDLEGHKLFTSASIGIALSSSGCRSPEDILRDADTTMYRAKAKGGACHAVFDPGMHVQVVALQTLEAELRQAVERQEFELYYQPIVSLATNQIAGVEALLRWHHPERGVITPDEFISLAEETGLIVPIGEWAMRTACFQIKTWHNIGYSSVRLSVNISVRQFQRGGSQDLPQLIAAILKETALPARVLELEITESLPLVDNDFNQAILGELKALGLRIALDDFGIGSSLGVLKQFPINTLKIDRSFVKEIIDSFSDAAIIMAIIEMAHSLGLKVVAEGVETEGQVAWLQAQQCDEIQGYLFSPPVPAPELTKLLQENLFL